MQHRGVEDGHIEIVRRHQEADFRAAEDDAVGAFSASVCTTSRKVCLLSAQVSPRQSSS